MNNPSSPTFSDLLRGQMEQLDAEMAELVYAVLDTGRGGSLTLRLDFSLMTGDDLTVEVKDQITVKAPLSSRRRPAGVPRAAA